MASQVEINNPLAVGINGDLNMPPASMNNVFYYAPGPATVFSLRDTANAVLTPSNAGLYLDITGGAGVASFSGSDFGDQFIGGLNDDFLIGYLGNDTLEGGAGFDSLNGGAGIDTASYEHSGAGVLADLSNAGNNTGDAQGDTYTSIENLRGSRFSDTLTGNAGDNILNDGGLGGADKLTGGGGDDSYSVYNAGTAIVENSGEGTDRVNAGVDYVLASGISAEYLNTTSVHATYAINLTGNEIKQLVRGNDGGNVLDGAGGNDWLFGMGGSDTFRFSTALSNGNVDKIMDFNVAEDQIALSSSIFAALGVGALDASAFKDSFLAPRDADDRIIYNSNTGSLFYDADGSGNAFAAVKFAVLASGLSLTAADFVVI
ncbi:calcium-binding protein [Mesorhizobium sp. IMUNJ 23232]|uniref:calcium-binding protein n=1 Tax=Mesorhizobium sp. IMUNJ 23232 TaxID=3376064 RepID=UPI00379D9EED